MAFASRSRCPSTPVSLQRVRLDRGGYDSVGRYFGVGEPVFVAYADDVDHYHYLRARDWKAAKDKLRGECPSIRFRR